MTTRSLGKSEPFFWKAHFKNQPAQVSKGKDDIVCPAFVVRLVVTCNVAFSNVLCSEKKAYASYNGGDAGVVR